ncbi:MAG TPA: Trm112 family protein [Candidatus Latescibacteria bacterium]|nr:Trm112 family protein [Candidatus Latescibacterota bacterium]
MRKELLDILVCPKCKGDLDYSEAEQTLTCRACRLRYEIKNGIPIMLVDKAIPIPSE